MKKKIASAKGNIKKAASGKKPTPEKVSTKTAKIPAGREHKLAEQALKFLDDAASHLRAGIRNGAATTAKSRISAKKKAHGLLGKASSNLSKAINESTSAIQNLIGKI